MDLLDVTLGICLFSCGFEQENVRVESSARCYLYPTHDASNVPMLWKGVWDARMGVMVYAIWTTMS